MRRIGMLIVVLAFVAAACGSSGSKATTPATKPSTDQRVIAAGLIQPSDLRGWVHSPNRDDSGPETLKLARGVAGCEHFVAVLREGSPKRDSETFERDDQQVDSAVEAYPSAAVASEQLDLARDPTTLSCQRDILRTFSAARFHATVKGLDISPIAVSDLGDGEFAFRVTMSMDFAGESIDLLLDTVVVQSGRFILSFDVSAPTTAGLAELETTLLPKLVARMKQAGA